ncbi:MAG TPA: prolyl oligopeptidase family serine peptidase [Thermomicrobiales bacterium]|nr:prolyl oligopeptidase family serine peptidase [Thermomicrobiales bacterium]
MTETNTSRSATQSTHEPEEDTAAETPDPTSTDVDTTAPDAMPEPAAEANGIDPADTRPQVPSIYANPVREPGVPEASPDGRWLAYLYPAEDGRRELWLSPMSGDEAVKLDLPFEPVDDVDPETGRQIRGPQWSPDGTAIAVTGRHPDGDRTAVWLVSLDTVAVEPAPVVQAAPESSDETGEPAPEAPPDAEPTAATPEGDAPESAGDPTEATAEQAQREPVASRAAPSAAPTVTAARLLADRREPVRSPRWSPDGTLMLVVTTRDGVDQIGIAQPRLDDDIPPLIEPLTSGSLPHREPIWSRDGRFIAFTRQHGDDYRFADICIFEPQTGEMKNLTGEKDANVRHSLDWVPGRNLVSFVTRDGDWLGISVVNADNKAGWMVTREAGDKWGHRFAPDEARLIYIRSEGFSTVLVERGLHGSGTVALDPGEGVVTTPVWVGAKKVAYGFSAPQKPLGWFVQESTAEAERTVVALPELVTAGRTTLRHPAPFEFDVGPDEQFSGLLYVSEGVTGPVPGAVYVADGPLTARLAGFQRDEQALASSGFAVLSPVMHGATGFGTAVEDDLADYSDSELEAADLAAAGEALGEREGVDASKLVVIGHGYGGTLAMVAAGARPGIFSTVVAIDPITDWTLELDQADRAWRQWVIRQYGLPLTNADRYALRAPETFAGVIGGDLILVSTPAAPEGRAAQMLAFRLLLDELGIAYTHLEVDTMTPPATLYEVGQYLAQRLRTTGQDESA